MTCKRYWREGVVLAERGEPDPHRDTCSDCRREHAARAELVRALPMVGAGAASDPQWQARVWQQIARETVRPVRTRAWRYWWSFAGPMVAACAALMLWFVLRHPGEMLPADHSEARARELPARELPDGLPHIEIFAGPITMRSRSARVGDRVRITALPNEDIRVYRADRLILRCTAEMPSSACTGSAQGIVVETAFSAAGEYQLVVIKTAAVAPVETLSRDLAAVIDADSGYDLTSVSIR
jgi:hypothetical protein